MSPRRSSRAHTTQPTPSAPQQNNSSTSSVSSGRADRKSRSHHKLPSPRSSAAPRSQSSEELDGSAKPQSRRTRSSQDDVKPEMIRPPADEDDGEESEEEVTRCICGHQEYPGMPVVAIDPAKAGTKKNGDTVPPIALQEDAGGLFIQCDVCKVWQHGGCVGIMDEAMSPEEYFCEQCRKDLHQITITLNGQKYSRYLPVQESTSPQSSPIPTTQEHPSKKSKETKASRLEAAEALAGKRRSTMNSRDSAYDEAEQLRRAIEESKKEVGAATSTDTSTQRGKRSRSESEQRLENTKRQRTTSSSPSNSKTVLQEAESEDEDETTEKSGEGGYKKIRGAAARNHRNKELREREERRERERADAAGRRKGRAERRRENGTFEVSLLQVPRANSAAPRSESDPSEEPLSRTTSSKGTDPTSIPLPSVLPISQDLPPTKPSHKKTGRPPARRGRVGRNQYTKDRDPRGPDSSIHADTSPTRSHSRDAADESASHLNGHGTHLNSHYNHDHSSGGGGGHSKSSKHSRGTHALNPNRTSMNDMKRRVAGILEFISRTQIEMAADPLASSRTPTTTTSPTTAAVTRRESNKRTDETDRNSHIELKKSLSSLLGESGSDTPTFPDFGGLNSVEMMEVLTRRLMRWQGEFGKVREK